MKTTPYTPKVRANWEYKDKIPVHIDCGGIVHLQTQMVDFQDEFLGDMKRHTFVWIPWHKASYEGPRFELRGSNFPLGICTLCGVEGVCAS